MFLLVASFCMHEKGFDVWAIDVSQKSCLCILGLLVCEKLFFISIVFQGISANVCGVFFLEQNISSGMLRPSA